MQQQVAVKMHIIASLCVIGLMLVTETTSQTCAECSSVSQPVNCPANEFLMMPETVTNVQCVYGNCYSTLETINGKVETLRGCTNNLPDMPYTLPAEGAYIWRGKTINICASDLCNILPPEESSGKSLYDHLKNPVDIAERGPIDCYQCMNYDQDGKHYPQCPKDKNVIVTRAFAGECNTTCFTKTFGDNPNRVARGCTDSQWGLPYPLPPDGCYNWENGIYCVCNSAGCNGRPIGKSSGRELDDHWYTDTNVVFEEEDGLNRCFECINYDSEGNYYKQCPKNKRVRNAFYSVCNGSCFTHSYDYDDKLVARGCTNSQYGLPDPLPPDGCYKWYTDTWCVCSTSRCNRHPIGAPQDIEFDAHITTTPNPYFPKDSAVPQTLSMVLVTSCLFLVLFWGRH